MKAARFLWDQNITVDEFRARVGRIQRSMRAHGLDALLVYSWPREWPFSKSGNMRYITNWPGDRDRTLCLATLTVDSAPSLILSNKNYLELAKDAVWFEDVAAVERDFAQDAKERLAKDGFQNGMVGVAGMDDVPLGTYQRFRDIFKGSQLVDAEDVITQIRMVKTHAEIELIRRATNICEVALGAFKEASSEGTSEHKAYAKMEFTAMLEGAEQGGSTTSSGPYLGTQPSTPRNREYRAGDGIIVAPVFRYQGYWAQVIRSGVVGTPVQEQSEIHEVLRQSLRAAMNAIGPGKNSHDVLSEATRVLKEGGYEGRDHLHFKFMHALGLSYQEKPVVNFHAESRDLQMAFEPGMVFVVHPNILLPEARLGAAIGDVCLVTDAGREVLSHSSIDLFSV